MSRSLRVWICVAVLLLCLPAVQLAAQQVSRDVRFQAAAVELDGNASVLRQWERDALWSLWITVLGYRR